MFTTELTRQMYAERYPGYDAAKWAVIEENGYDEENFTAAEEAHRADGARAPWTTHPGAQRHSFIPRSATPAPFSRRWRHSSATVTSPRRTSDRLRATGDGLYARCWPNKCAEHRPPRTGRRVPRALREMLRADMLLFQEAPSLL